MRSQKISQQSLATWFADMAELLDSGMTLYQALETLAQDLAPEEGGQLASHLQDLIREGEPLSQAGQPYWPDAVCSAIRSGEMAGQLSQVLQSIAQEIHRRHHIRTRVWSEVRYPLAVLSLVAVAIAGLLHFLVPTMTEFLKLSGQPLPIQTRLLITTAEYLPWGLVILFGTIAASTGLHHWYSSRTTQIRRLSLRSLFSWSRFCRVTAMLYRAGIPIDTAVTSACDGLANPTLSRLIKQRATQIRAGFALDHILEQGLAIPSRVLRLIKLGERQGKLDLALIQAANYAEAQAIKKLERLFGTIGPVATLIAAGFLSWVIWAFILPIYDMVNQVS